MISLLITSSGLFTLNIYLLFSIAKYAKKLIENWVDRSHCDFGQQTFDRLSNFYNQVSRYCNKWLHHIEWFNIWLYLPTVISPLYFYSHAYIGHREWPLSTETHNIQPNEDFGHTGHHTTSDNKPLLSQWGAEPFPFSPIVPFYQRKHFYFNLPSTMYHFPELGNFWSKATTDSTSGRPCLIFDLNHFHGLTSFLASVTGILSTRTGCSTSLHTGGGCGPIQSKGISLQMKSFRPVRRTHCGKFFNTSVWTRQQAQTPPNWWSSECF